jgi:hypothetical protein
MNYCLLEDAWGKEQKIVQQKNVEHFSETPIKYNYINCDDFINHINNCKTCNNKLRNKYRSKILYNINDIINGNKEGLVLILMGIFILLFFNLIYNLTKN